MPEIPTIVAAAMPISNKADATKLFDYLRVLLDGLTERGLKIVAYAAMDRQLSEQSNANSNMRVSDIDVW
jgi:hypothetical protein